MRYYKRKTGKKTIKQITKINNIDVLINNAAYNPKFNSKKYSFSIMI